MQATNLHSKGLLEVLQKTVSLKFIEVVAIGTPSLIEVSGLVNELPDLLSLLLAELLHTIQGESPVAEKIENDKSENDSWAEGGK